MFFIFVLEIKYAIDTSEFVFLPKLLHVIILATLSNTIQYYVGHCYNTTTMEGISCDVCNITT